MNVPGCRGWFQTGFKPALWPQTRATRWQRHKSRDLCTDWRVRSIPDSLRLARGRAQSRHAPPLMGIHNHGRRDAERLVVMDSGLRLTPAPE